jgi:GH25 family lysozyme M1 (1,4-beta-N-acetylmuramidase)
MFGTDVSKWQGNIEWETIPQHWAQFVYVRAKGSEGGRDETFKKNYYGAALTNRWVGSYGFVRWIEDPVEWANDWMDMTDPHWSKFNMRPMIDVEAPHSHQVESREYHDSITVQQRQDWLRKAIDVVSKRQAPPLLYTGFNYWRSSIGGTSEWKHLPLCIARYTHIPGDISHPSFGLNQGFEPWDNWTVHQYTSSDFLPGTKTRVDRLFLNFKYPGSMLIPAFDTNKEKYVSIGEISTYGKIYYKESDVS